MQEYDFNIDIEDSYEYGLFAYDASGATIAEIVAVGNEKIEEIETTAEEATVAFNTNAATKTAYFDSHAESLQKEVSSLKTVRNVIPKVESEGTEIKLDKTGNATFEEFALKGIASQETTSGKNLFNNIDAPTVNLNATAQTIDTGVKIISPQGNQWAGCVYVFFELTDMVGQNITISCNVNPNGNNLGYVALGRSDIDGGNRRTLKNTSNSGDITLSTIVPEIEEEDVSKYLCVVLDANSTGAVETGAFVEYTNLQLEINSIKTSFEPYCGGTASPNPDYPQDIHVVSGDNEIKVENKNLFNKNSSNEILNMFINYVSSPDNYNLLSGNKQKSVYMPCKPNTTYTISKIASARFVVGYTTEIPAESVNVYGRISNNSATNITITTGEDATYLVVFCYHSDYDTNLQQILDSIQIELSSSATSYVEHREQTYHITLPNGMEMAGIGNYEDELRRSTGKNLFNDTLELGSINTSGVNTSSTSALRSVSYTAVEPNTTYTLSSSFSTRAALRFYDENQEFLSVGTTNDTPNTFTTPASCHYLRIVYSEITNTSIFTQLEEGSVATDLEPYGVGVWYKYAAIGKVVLDGSEDWQYAEDYNYFRCPTFNFNGKNPLATNEGQRNQLCTHFRLNWHWSGTDSFRDNVNVQGEFYSINNANYKICIRNTDYTTAADLKTWLSNNNTIVYYILSIPSVTEITDTTLISQLDDIYYNTMSYEEQTNISQTNNDAPFNIKATALKDLTILFNDVTNALLEIGGE